MSSSRQKLIEIYMKIAEGFYYEGSDAVTEREEYAPAFANKVLGIVLTDIEALEKSLPENRARTITDSNGSKYLPLKSEGFNEALDQVHTLLNDFKEKWR